MNFPNVLDIETIVPPYTKNMTNIRIYIEYVLESNIYRRQDFFLNYKLVELLKSR